MQSSTGILPDYIEEYIRNKVPVSKDGFKEMENYAKENGVPIIHKEVAQFLKVFINSTQKRRILEVGTAIGYSALVFADSFADGDGLIDSIEIREKSYNIAKENIEKYKKEGVSINLYLGDALDVLPEINNKYDIIFLDAGKSHYDKYFKYVDKFLCKGGIIISDNVLYKGMIASDELIIKRKKTIVKNMRNYLDYLVDNTNYETTIIPLGDGLAISVKLGD